MYSLIFVKICRESFDTKRRETVWFRRKGDKHAACRKVSILVCRPFSFVLVKLKCPVGAGCPPSWTGGNVFTPLPFDVFLPARESCCFSRSLRRRRQPPVTLSELFVISTKFVQVERSDRQRKTEKNVRKALFPFSGGCAGEGGARERPVASAGLAESAGTSEKRGIRKSSETIFGRVNLCLKTILFLANVSINHFLLSGVSCLRWDFFFFLNEKQNM